MSCVAGQSYCSVDTFEPTGNGYGRTTTSCQPLCAANDCSCFCDNPDGCTFKPPGSPCALDTCNCRVGTISGGVPLPGTVEVGCTYHPACNVDAGVDGP